VLSKALLSKMARTLVGEDGERRKNLGKCEEEEPLIRLDNF
jgi:hypothetical protein